MKKINTREIVKLYKDGDAAYKDTSAYRRLREALAEAQRRARVRKISVEDILDDILAVKNAYKIIGPKALQGTTYKSNIRHQTFPAAYHGDPESTWYCATMVAGGAVVITHIYRGYCTTDGLRAKLSDTAKAKLVDEYEYYW